MAATVSMVGRAEMAATEAMVATAVTEAMAGRDGSTRSNGSDDGGGTIGKSGNKTMEMWEGRRQRQQQLWWGG